MARCSVIIPAYNVDAYVAQAIESALSQTHPDTQVIVVNDGSTDGTAEMIAPYRDRIVLIEQENRGLAAARNSALREATGEYIAFLDADDSWLPERLEKMLKFLEVHPEFGFATSDACLIYEETVSSDTYYEHKPKRLRFREHDQAYWITRYNFIFVMTVIRRELFDNHGSFDDSLRAAEDWDLWLRFLVAGERVGLLKEPLAYYRSRKGSLSVGPARIWPEEARVLEKALESPGGSSIPGLAGRAAFSRAKIALANENVRVSKKYFTEAARDRELELKKRITATAASIAPRLAWHWYIKRQFGLGALFPNTFR